MSASSKTRTVKVPTTVMREKEVVYHAPKVGNLRVSVCPLRRPSSPTLGPDLALGPYLDPPEPISMLNPRVCPFPQQTTPFVRLPPRPQDVVEYREEVYEVPTTVYETKTRVKPVGARALLASRPAPAPACPRVPPPPAPTLAFAHADLSCSVPDEGVC
jgi:hypothetical protein